ncbi:Multidrug ABC transporter substrate-binding protein [Flavobacterium sp. 9AF]|uniref:ABC transporter permease n=1 Tax=Flavobacterium sp. 9AF TaxID=2653142 RepID=UPI0012F236BB|nr:ABC transporter permease [Flavobacterium sp. 9AF]VXB24646.1 Multidrug ABC transporter substrate-binding protein [Flavobacterium sp. 9AF]
MLKNWINLFLYHIKTNKLFTFLNITGLSIGIAGLIFAILYWNEEQSYNAWNPEKERIHQVISDLGEGIIWGYTASPLESYIKDMSDVASHCYFNTWYYNEIIEYNGKKELIEKIFDAQNNFFEFFPFKFIKGDPKTAIQDNNSIALSEEVSKRLFGNVNPIGKQVHYSGRTLVVRGVYRLNKKSSIAPEAVTNIIDKQLLENKDQWGNFNYGLLLKLKDPLKKEKVENELDALFLKYKLSKEAKDEGISIEEYKDKYGSIKNILEPLAISRLHSKAHGYPEGRGNYQTLLILFGLSILILILSIVNYVNLATANAVKRAKEVGIRKVLGATKSNIVKQFIFETVILVLFSIFLALVIVELSLSFYNDFLDKDLIIHGKQFYLQIIFIFIITIVVAGIFPSIYVSNFETLKVIKGNFIRSKSGIWFRNGLLILQFAIATFFIVGSYVVYEQVKYMLNKDLGFRGDQVIAISYRNPYDYKEEGYRKKLLTRYHTIKQEISKIQGVNQVSTGTFKFGDGASSSSSFQYKDRNVQGQNMAVDFGLLEMLKIEMKEGRNFDSNFASDTINSMLINETVQRMIGEKDPIGKTISWNGKDLKIIGVVKDFHLYGPQAEIPPMSFFHFKTIDWMLQNVNTIYVKVNAENLESTLNAIEKFWIKNVDTDYPFNYEFVDKSYAKTFDKFINQKNVFSFLNIIVILIALFGLFALASYSIQRRMKEIAIRKTLGAETHVLLKELSKQYVLFCLIGFVLAIFPAYYLLNLWLNNFAYRIDVSFIPFVIGFVVLLFLTLIIVLSKAYQATKVDVLKYLKYE